MTATEIPENHEPAPLLGLGSSEVLGITLPEAKGTTMDIDTGDHVKHGPSGQTWVVAYVEGDRLAWCGWPEGEAKLADCTLTKKATPEQRDKLLLEMADCTNDRRGRYARQRLCMETR